MPRGGLNLGKSLVCSLSRCRTLVCSLCNTPSPCQTNKGPPGPIGGLENPVTSLARQVGGALVRPRKGTPHLIFIDTFVLGNATYRGARGGVETERGEIHPCAALLLFKIYHGDGHDRDRD